MQIEALAPVAAAANTFAEEYKSFTTAIDATRHKLPGKNVHIGEDAGQFLGLIRLTWRKKLYCVLDSIFYFDVHSICKCFVS